jgi:hypothetical protein
MSKPAKVVPEKVIDYQSPESTIQFSSKDAVIYALGNIISFI